MNKALSLLTGSSLLLLLFAACTEPISVGSDLVEGELADIGQTTTLEFTTQIVREDSLIIYDESEEALVPGFNFGRLSDEVAGTWRHSLTFVPQTFRDNAGETSPPSFVVDTDTQVDSIVLIIPIDTSFDIYGEDPRFDFTMRMLENRVDTDLEDYFSNRVFPTTSVDLNQDSEISVTEAPRLLYDTIYTGGDSNNIFHPHIRLRFSDAFVAEFNARDSTSFNSDDAFYAFFPGVSIAPTDATQGIVNLQPSANRAGLNPFGGFFFFYPDTTDQDPTFTRRPFDLWLPTYEKDFSSSLAGDLLQPGADEEQLLIAGQAGIMTAITFPDLSALENTVINQAEIKFYLEEVAGYDYAANPTPSFVALYYRNSNGELINIEDRNRLGNPNNNIIVRQFLGGDPQTDDDGNTFYLPRFSVHMQRMLNEEVPNTIFLRVVPIDRDPSRAVLSGPNAAVRPASVKVTFTELD